MTTYNRLPVTFERGTGAWLWDSAGKKYLDAVSGVAVCGLGHSHPAVTHAICAQAGVLLHTSNLYQIARQVELAHELTVLAGMDAVFFGNSGAEANEAAIKLARLHGHARGIAAPSIVVAEQSFHGRTLATLSATGNRRVQAGFEPLVQGFVRVPYDDLDSIATVARNRQDVAAVLIEPVQGEAGVRLPGADYLAGIRALCDAHGWLFMLDEIQSGMGRSGRYFAFQHTSIRPDVMTLAKGLGNGVPIGACLAHGEAAHLFKPGNHGSTFGGNPLACSAALAVLHTLREDHLPERAALVGARMKAAFETALAGVSGVVEIRGLGLMLAIELDRPCAALSAQALEQGLLINVTAEKVVRLLPPLIIDDEQAQLIVDTVSILITDWLR